MKNKTLCILLGVMFCMQTVSFSSEGHNKSYKKYVKWMMKKKCKSYKKCDYFWAVDKHGKIAKHKKHKKEDRKDVNKCTGGIIRTYNPNGSTKTMANCYEKDSYYYNKGFRFAIIINHENGKQDKRITARERASGEIIYQFSSKIYDKDWNKIGQDYHPATEDEIKFMKSYIE